MTDYLQIKSYEQQVNQTQNINNVQNSTTEAVADGNSGSAQCQPDTESILDKVEQGDISVLKQLGIPYTEFSVNGEKKISFKYQDIRYYVNIVGDFAENDVRNVNVSYSQTVKCDDGSYTINEYDSKDNLVQSTDYDKDGIAVKIRAYNEKGQLVKVTDKEYMADGSCRQVVRNNRGDIIKIIYTNGVDFDRKVDVNDEAFVDELRKLVSEYQKQAEEIEKEINEITPSYRVVLYKDKEALQNYEDKISELNKKEVEYQVKIAQINNQISDIVREQKLSKAEKTLETIQSSSGANRSVVYELEKVLEEYRKNNEDLSQQKLELKNKLWQINSQLEELENASQPSEENYKNEDGSYNTEAYNEAVNNYKMSDTKMVELQKELSDISAKLSELEKNEGTEIIDAVNSSAEAIKTMQDMINGLEDNFKNSTIITQLKQYQRNICSTISSEISVIQMNSQYIYLSSLLDNYVSQINDTVNRAVTQYVNSGLQQLRSSGKSVDAYDCQRDLNNYRREYQDLQMQKANAEYQKTSLMYRQNSVERTISPDIINSITSEGYKGAKNLSVQELKAVKTYVSTMNQVSDITQQISELEEKMQNLQIEMMKIVQ